MRIPFSKPSINLDVLKDIEKVIKSGWLIEGKYTAEFEAKFSEHVGVKYAVATSSGTTALFLALKALGIKNGDEVIVPSLTFAASSNVILHVGASPVFADVDKDTFNLNPKSVKGKITKKTKAIMPVHLYGQACDMGEINEIAKKHDLKVIEDSAQAIGALYKNKKTGSLGNAGCFSFHPIKNITTGEGGMITTDKKEVYDKIIILKNHGIQKSVQSDRKFIEIGYNFRLPEINAVIGISQLKDLDKNNKLRCEKAKLYKELLRVVNQVTIPYFKPYNIHTYSAYTLKCKKRDVLMQFLQNNGISCLVRHPPVHLEPIYRKLFNFQEGSLPVTETVAKELLCLPMFPSLPEEDIRFVCNKIKYFYSE